MEGRCVASVEAEERRRLRLLWEADRLLGLKDWPVRRDSPEPPGAGACEDTSVVARKTPRPVAVPTAVQVPSGQPPVARMADSDLDARLRAVMQAFPPEIDPPGIEPEARPDPLVSARYALKGSAVQAVKLKAETLAGQAEHVASCTRCGLCKVSTQSVFGIGHPDTRIVFVGEAPGAEEDKTGHPFVGRAGKLLTAMVERGMGLRREHVYICNVVKHRPPENRTPSTDEIAACQDHLWQQLSVIEPEFVVALGAPATHALLSTRESLGRMRGQFFEIHLSGSDLTGGPVARCLPTYHPAYLLRYPADKKKAWEDLKKVMAAMGIPSSGEQERA